MGRVVVHVEGVPGEELASVVADALEHARKTQEWASKPLAQFEVVTEPDRGRPTGRAPSAHYGEALQAKLKEGRFEAVTPNDVVAWWASRFRATFQSEDASLQAARAFPEHEGAVRQALRRFHDGEQRALLRYLTAVLRWWRGRRDRQDVRTKGFPRLRHVLSSDWLIGLWRSGDMGRELDGEERR